MGVAEGIREESAEAAGTALGGGYALGQALFLAVGEYLDGVLVFGTVVVEVLVPLQGQDAVLDGDFGEGDHGDGTYGQLHVFQRDSAILYPIEVDEGVADGHGVLRGVVAHADLEGREQFGRQGDHVAELAAVGLLGLGAGVGDGARLGAHKPLVVTAVADDGADGAGKAAEDALMEFCHDGMCLIFIQLRVSTLTDVLLKPYLASMCMDNGRVGEILFMN